MKLKFFPIILYLVFLNFLVSGETEKFISPLESIDLYSDTFLFFPDHAFDCSREKLFCDTKYQGSYGIDVKFTGFNLRCFNSSSKLTFQEISEKNHREIFSRYRYSFTGDFSKIPDFPVEGKIFWGSLSCAGSFSRMNNPSFTMQSSPFTHIPPLPGELKILLPSKTSSTKPETLAFNFILPVEDSVSKNAKVPKMDSRGFISEPIKFSFAFNDSSKKASVFTGFRYKNFLRVQESFSAGTFTLYPSKNTLWYDSWPNHSQTDLMNFLNEIYFSMPFIKTTFSYSAIENPFNSLRTWVRNETLFSAGGFALSSSVFLRDDFYSKEKMNLICPDGSTDKYFLMTKLTPEVSVFIKEKNILTIGLGGTYGESLDEQGLKEKTSEKFSFSTGIKTSSAKLNTHLTYSMNDVYLKELPPGAGTKILPYHTWDTGFTHYMGKKNRYSLQLNANIKYRPNVEEIKNRLEETLRLSLYRRNSFLNTISLQVNGSQQKLNNSLSFTARAGFFLTIKKIRMHGSISMTEGVEL